MSRTFDGRTTFPEEDDPATNEFIIRYIQWALDDFDTIEEVKHFPEEPPKVVYKIFKKGTGDREIRIKQGFTLNRPGYLVNGTSCGVVSGPDSTFPVHDLKGVPLYELNDMIDEYYR